MPKKFSTFKKNNPVPTSSNLPKKSNSSGSIAGNVVGGMASGFGIGTGIEAARGLSGAIFGSNQSNPEPEVSKVNNDKEGCKILSEMISKCQEKNDGFNDCNDLLKMFSDKCLPN